MAPWFRDKGDKTLRLDYPLTEMSTVFDLGGFEGQWASDIYSKYRPKIYVFEPVPHFYEFINIRFANNPDIKAYGFGLASNSFETVISLSDDGSSLYNKAHTTHSVKVFFKQINDFIKENKIDRIDLIKINIEGGEYELLEYIIENGLINTFKNIQVQFHDFVPNAEARMTNIQTELSKTHELSYQYKFVWENWRIIE